MHLGAAVSALRSFVWGLVCLSFPATAATTIVPVVLDVNTGSAWYRTELIVTNRGPSTAELVFHYTGSSGSVTGDIPESIAAGSQTTIPDLIARLRDRGIAFPPSSPDTPQIGTLLISVPDSLADFVTVLARTTSPTTAPHPAGNAGLAYLGLSRAEWPTKRAIVPGLRATGSDRSNLAVYNPASSPVTLRITLTSGSGDGREFVLAAEKVVPPGGWSQWDRVLTAAGMTNGWATIELVSGEAFGCYGVVNDNGTNDGSFLEPITGVPARSRQVVPVIVETDSYSTELILTNRSASPATLTLEYKESLSPGAGSGGRASLTLAPRQQRLIGDALEVLRGLGVAIGEAGSASFAGTLRITSDNADPADLFTGARVSARSTGPGFFGVFLPGLTDSQLASEEAFVTGLRSDSGVQSNLAVLHAGDAASGTLTLEVQFFNGEAGGAAAGPAEMISLPPGGWKQLDNPLRGRGVATGWARIRRVAGSAPWSAYGVLNDGANPKERTDDGAFVRALPGAPPASRLSPSDFTYLGAFRLPETGPRPNTFDYGGNAMTYRTGGDPAGPADGFPGSLFVSGHDRMPYGELPDGSRVAEVTIPAPGLSRSVSELPRAGFLQPFADVTGGLFAGLDEIPRLGLQYLDRMETGPKLHITWGQHFQPDPPAPSHAWCDPALSSPNPKGAWFLGEQNPYAVNGYLLEIPAFWADRHVGGRVLGTGRYRDGGWSGMGPALFAYKPWMDAAGTPPPARARLSEIPLLQYATSTETDRIVRCLSGYQHADAWEGGAFVTTASGKSALIFAGTKSIGAKYWYGYLNPAGAELPCVDQSFVGQFDVCRLADGTPCPAADLVECAGHTSSRGWWSTRAVGRLIFYDPADLGRVAEGTLAPHEPQPYALLDIDDRLFLNPSGVEEDEIGRGVQRRYRLGDVAFDRVNGLLYILELFADGPRPVVHVFQIR